MLTWVSKGIADTGSCNILSGLCNSLSHKTSYDLFIVLYHMAVLLIKVYCVKGVHIGK